jgi:hypothetical protein
MIGQELSPILEEIEDTLWEFEANDGSKPNYTIEGFRGATKIFMSVLMDKIWELQANENIPMENRIQMVEKAGQDVRQLIKTYTDIDTHQLYTNKNLTNDNSRM